MEPVGDEVVMCRLDRLHIQIDMARVEGGKIPTMEEIDAGWTDEEAK